MTSGASFTARVKRELASVRVPGEAGRRAELAGLLRAAGSLHLRAGGPVVELVTGEAAVARKAFVLLKEQLGRPPRVLVRRRRNLGRGNVYVVRVPGPAAARAVLVASGVWRADGTPARGLPAALVRGRSQRAAFLRGCFLGGGHVSPPERGYHLELLLRDAAVARDVQRLLARLGLPAGLVPRDEGYAVYLKEGDGIVTLLGLMGAHGAVLAFEEARVRRDLRGRLNRMVNAETANLAKAAAAAAEQLADIRRLAAAGVLLRLPPGLRQLAEVRLRHPELSLRELGQVLEPPLSKSAVAHRMRRLRSLARQLAAGRPGRDGAGGGEPAPRRRTGRRPAPGKGMASQAPE